MYQTLSKHTGISTAGPTSTAAGLPAPKLGGLSLPQSTATTTVRPTVATTATGLGLGQGLQTSTSSGLKLSGLATTSAASSGAGIGLGGLKPSTAAPTLGLATTTAATTSALKTDFKGLGGVGTAETGQGAAGRDG